MVFAGGVRDIVMNSDDDDGPLLSGEQNDSPHSHYKRQEGKIIYLLLEN